MCTILTLGTKVDGKQHSNTGPFVERVIADYQANHDGITILTHGKYPSILRSMDINLAVDFLEVALKDTDVDRVWVHMRAATTGSVGVDYTHGWTDGRGMAVLHNGILYTGNARKHAVDSMQLVEMLKQGYTPDEIHRMLDVLYEGFANILFVDTDTGTYHLSTQSKHGVLTDGKGNYSSKAIPELGITKPVLGPVIHEHLVDGSTPVIRGTSGDMIPWTAEEVREYMKRWEK